MAEVTTNFLQQRCLVYGIERDKGGDGCVRCSECVGRRVNEDDDGLLVEPEGLLMGDDDCWVFVRFVRLFVCQQMGNFNFALMAQEIPLLCGIDEATTELQWCDLAFPMEKVRQSQWEHWRRIDDCNRGVKKMDTTINKYTKVV